MLPKIASVFTSISEHPNRITLNIFLPYCNFNCIACHNRDLVEGEFEEVPMERFIWELENNMIAEMIVVSGGEPAIHGPGLLELVKLLRSLRGDLPIRIDSNGSLPEVLELISEQVDGFAVDVKAPPLNVEKYERIIRRKFQPEKLLRSIEIAADLPLTVFRTVKYPWLSESDIEEIRAFLSHYGKPHIILPYFEPLGLGSKLFIERIMDGR